MRVDKLLWYLRFVGSRAAAQALVAAGHLRVNGRRVERAALGVAIGDILTIPLGRTVRVVAIAALPIRRGPAPEAQACYRLLDAGPVDPIAASQIGVAATDAVTKEDMQP